MANFYFTRAGLKLILDASKVDLDGVGAVDGPLLAGFMGLFTAWPGTFDVDQEISDYTEAAYTGYARQAVVFGDQYKGSDGRPSQVHPSLEFRPDDDVVGSVILGCLFMSLITGGVLLGVGVFGEQIPLPDEDSVCVVQLEQSWPTDAIWGSVNVVN